MSFTAQITANIDGFSRGIDQAAKGIDKLQKTVTERLSDVGKSFENIGKKASILSAALVAAGGKAFLMASDFEDALGATDQVFQESSGIMKNWANNLSTNYGVAKKEALEYSNMMGTMLTNIGKLSQEESAKTSQKLVELAGDLTAMYGGKVEEAVSALTSSLRGSNISLTRYGVAINDVMLKAKAMKMGLVSSGKEMSLSAKQAATLALIYEQTSAAQGQAAREADSASGSMRALKTEITNLSTELGQILLPIITPVVTKIREMVSAIRDLSPEMQSLIVKIGGVTAALGPILVMTGQLLQVLPKIKTAIAALANPVTAVVAGVVVAAKRIADEWGLLSTTLLNIQKGFSTTFKGDFESLWKYTKDTFNNNLEWLKNKIADFANSIAKLLDAVGLDKWGDSLRSLSERIAPSMEAVSDVVDQVTQSVKDQTEVLDDVANAWDGAAESAKGAADVFKDGSDVYALIRRTSDEIIVLTKRLDGLRNGTVAVENVKGEIEKTEQKVQELSKALDLLTGNRDLNINLKISKGLDELHNGNLLKPIVVPAIDTSLIESSMGKFDQISSELINMSETFNNTVATSISGGMQKIIEGVMSVEGVNAASIVGALLTPFGDLTIRLGETAIAAGIGIGAIKKAFESMNPYVALAAGAALIALGATIKGAVSSMGRNMGGGGSSSYQGGALSYNNTPSMRPSEYRGPYRDDWGGEVVFKIGNNELIGVLEHGMCRKNRIG